MKNAFETYIQVVSSKYSHLETSEYGYRTDFENLLKKLFELIKNLRIDHDPKAIDGNKPDFAILSGETPILFIEAKDIGTSLDRIERSNQMNRYFGYANLVLTDYLEFRFYRNGLKYCEPIKIAEYDVGNRSIAPIFENFELLEKTLTDFPKSFKEPIKSGKHLAKIMGGKAQRIRDNIRQFYSLESDKNTDLIRLYEAIKKQLVHDLNINSFSDMYAQTLVYGLFVARYYDNSLGSFSRQEARELIPNTNPLLRHFFDHIVGADFDSRLKYIVDELCEIFSHSDVQDLMKEYFKEDLWGKIYRGPDPVIHFYEDFLKEYDPILRKKMGAYYTPLPVVNFIINSVDFLLKKEFGLSAGLADTSKTKEGVHRVEILDPATGTGTFISTVIGNVYKYLIAKGQKGAWPSYVHHDLLPRLFGFELMMAPYTIAHLKLGIAFRRTGFWDFHRRLGIYLTNSLEESTVQQDLFSGIGLSESIAEESKEAAIIKNEKPIMVVVGNPPYSGVSSNNTDYANELVEKYKVEPGGKQKLQERKHWLNDDYVKFIAFAENMIAKNKEGIIGYITNHGYLDNPTFRGMRWKLMDTFDYIYLLDLHGNSKRKEISPDGSKDENVFDIQQGVSIMLAVKTGKKAKGDLAKVYRQDLWGIKRLKFEQLNKVAFKKMGWDLIEPQLPNLFFMKKGSTKLEEEYMKGFCVYDLFLLKSTGIVTMGDGFITDENKTVLQERLDNFLEQDITKDLLTKKYNLGKNYSEWLISNKKKITNDPNKIIRISYRPFESRYMYFDNNLTWRPRTRVMKHFMIGENIGLVTARSNKNLIPDHFFISKYPTEAKLGESSTQSAVFPLYVYSTDGAKNSNLQKEMVDKIKRVVGDTLPEDVLSYIYAVLYSPSYRQRNKTLLKSGFPRVPYPNNKEKYFNLVGIGKELIRLHLLESPKVNKSITTYPEEGTNIVERITYKDGGVYINDNQYFGKVPKIAWDFYIGGYQPVQKWLKDKKGQELTSEDVEHYQKMIVALVETEKLMKKIDKVDWQKD